ALPVWFKAGVAIHNLGVIPGTGAEESSIVFVASLQVTAPFHSVGINITFLIVQSAVVVVIRRPFTTVATHNLTSIGFFSTPRHAIADVVIDLDAELTKIKFNGVDSGGT